MCEGFLTWIIFGYMDGILILEVSEIDVFEGASMYFFGEQFQQQDHETQNGIITDKTF